MFGAAILLPLLAGITGGVPMPKDLIAALHSPTAVTVYAINGQMKPPPSPTGEYLQDSPVLGKADLTATSQASATARRAFREAIGRVGGSMTSACFSPRHAMRVKTQRHTYDISLCYECSGAWVYVDNNPLAWYPARGTPRRLDALYRSLGLWK